jgi:hypothetical protein
LWPEIQQVERIVEQPVLAARGEIGMQQPEVRDASRAGNDGFAIQGRLSAGRAARASAIGRKRGMKGAAP